jgi:hypothetical protein
MPTYRLKKPYDQYPAGTLFQGGDTHYYYAVGFDGIPPKELTASLRTGKVDTELFEAVPEQPDSQAGDEQITYGVDMGAPNGDKTALSIKRGDIVYSFVGDEAEVILAYAERLATNRAIEAYKNTHDCRIKVSEKHIGMEMTPDIYAVNNIRRLSTTITKETDQ